MSSAALTPHVPGEQVLEEASADTQRAALKPDACQL